MELMKETLNFGDEVLEFDGCNFEDVARFLVKNKLKHPFHWSGETDVQYGSSMEEILFIVWNDPYSISIEGLEEYYSVIERKLIEDIRKATLHDVASRNRASKQ